MEYTSPPTHLQQNTQTAHAPTKRTRARCADALNSANNINQKHQQNQLHHVGLPINHFRTSLNFLRTGGTYFPYQLFGFCGLCDLEDGSGRTVSVESCKARACIKRLVPPVSYSAGPGSNLGQQLDYFAGWLGFPQIFRADGSVLS